MHACHISTTHNKHAGGAAYNIDFKQNRAHSYVLWVISCAERRIQKKLKVIDSECCAYRLGLLYNLDKCM